MAAASAVGVSYSTVVSPETGSMVADIGDQIALIAYPAKNNTRRCDWPVGSDKAIEYLTVRPSWTACSPTAP